MYVILKCTVYAVIAVATRWMRAMFTALLRQLYSLLFLCYYLVLHLFAYLLESLHWYKNHPSYADREDWRIYLSGCWCPALVSWYMNPFRTDGRRYQIGGACAVSSCSLLAPYSSSDLFGGYYWYCVVCVVDLLALLINHLLPKAFSYCSSAVSSNSKSVYYSLSLYEIVVIFEQLINVLPDRVCGPFLCDCLAIHIQHFVLQSSSPFWCALFLVVAHLFWRPQVYAVVCCFYLIVITSQVMLLIKLIGVFYEISFILFLFCVVSFMIEHSCAILYSEPSGLPLSRSSCVLLQVPHFLPSDREELRMIHSFSVME